MDSAAGNILFSSCLGGVLFVMGLALLWLGFIPFGQIAPHPRAFWGIPGAGCMVFGAGIFLIGFESGAPLPPGDMPAMLVHSAGFYLLLLSLLMLGIWGPWAYVQQCLYITRETMIAGKSVFEHERSGHLRRRHLALASTGVGGIVGYVAAGMLVSFSRTAPQGDLAPIAAAFGVGCVVGGTAFGVTFLVLRIWFRRELITE